MKEFRKARVAIAGTGWRADFFARICEALPERFELIGIMYHSEKSRDTVTKYNVPLTTSLDELCAMKPDYIVLSLNGKVMPDAMRTCARHGIPVLCETFTMENEEALNAFYAELKDAKIQFAEQYKFQPLNYARQALADKGVLGDVFHMRMSISTHHHPAALVRLTLGKGFELPVISAFKQTHRILKGPGRAGDPDKEEYVDAVHEITFFDYGDKLGINDFEANQHRSFNRSNYFLIRGSRGEIVNESASYMLDELTPVRIELKREVAGAGVDLQGMFLRGVSAGTFGMLYESEFMPARLYDDELAVASTMAGMSRYVFEGEGFYSFEEELTNMYFSLLTERALATGEKQQAQAQSWMK